MIREWLDRHPLPCYFALVFGISWGGILVVFAGDGFDLAPRQPVEGGLMFLMMLLGPSVAGIVCIALLDGRAGLRALWRAARRWRVAPRWWAAALLTAPVVLLAILLPLAAVAGPAFKPGHQWILLPLGLLARRRPGRAGVIFGRLCQVVLAGPEQD